MIRNCPGCNKAYDFDGFYEHGVETLYYCTCGLIFDEGHYVFQREQIDLTGLAGPGQFIKATRKKSIVQVLTEQLEKDIGSPACEQTQAWIAKFLADWQSKLTATDLDLLRAQFTYIVRQARTEAQSKDGQDFLGRFNHFFKKRQQ